MWEYNHNELYHYDIKGQRWGVRRYVNADGTLTPEGMARYGYIQDKNRVKALEKQDEKFFRTEKRIADVYRHCDNVWTKRNDKSRKRYEKLVAKTKDLSDTDVKVLKAKRKADEASGKLKEFDKKFDYLLKRAGDEDIIELAEKVRLREKYNFFSEDYFVNNLAERAIFKQTLDDDYQKNQKMA